MKVVINACHGGFSLSRVAYLKLRALKNPHALAEPDFGEYWSDGSGPRERSVWDTDERGGSWLRDIPRDDPQLVAVVKELGKKANGMCAQLKIVNIPKDAQWEIAEYDGYEHVAEKHRTWG